MFIRNQKIRNTVNLVAILSAIVILTLVTLDVWQNVSSRRAVTENEKLVVPKEKVVSYEFVKDENKKEVVAYKYISSVPVPAGSYRGLVEDVSKRTASSQVFLKEVQSIDEQTQAETYVGKFYGANTFAKDNEAWYFVETATTTPQAFAAQTRLTILDRVKELFGEQAFAATDTTYAGAGDGYTTYGGGDSDTWDSVHDALTGTSAWPTETTAYTGGGYSIFSGNPFLYRAFFPVDTSALPDAPTISSASLHLYVVADALPNDSYGFLVPILSTQASVTTLATADYDQCGAINNPTEGGDRVYGTSVNQDSYVTLPLNATGISWISDSGYTKLGVREGNDALDVAPAIVGTAAFATSEAADTTTDPYLEVTYTEIAPKKIKIDNGRIKIDNGRIKIN
ncbi:MAG: hypothetical protein HUU49_04015 [Candidatus Buchananbacteria bacterium]|nr:hypothetical protein [Candidatus Buchananbacteria bacterium]